MNLVTRRDVLRSSGCAMAVPLTISVFPRFAHAQTSNSSPSSSSLPKFSQDLADYVASGVGPIIPSARRGSLTQAQLHRAASTTRLFAQHIESLDLNNEISARLQSADYTSFISNLDSYRQKVFKSVIAFDPTTNLSDLRLSAMSQDQFEVAKQELSSIGIGGLYHRLADCYKEKANSLSNSTYQTADLTLNHRYHAVEPTSKYHLLLVGSGCHLSESDCKLLGKVASVMTYLGVGLFVACLFVPGVDFLCVGLAGSITLHGGLIQFLTDMGCGTWS